MAVEFGLLGSIEACIGVEPIDVGHMRQRSVLAVLLVDANRMVSVDQLVDRVWGEHPPQRAQATLYSYISRLRQALAPGTGEVGIDRRSGGYSLVVESSAVDLHCFRALLARARRAEDDCRGAALFEQALGLWRGNAFSALDTPWFNAMRESLHRERLTAELDLGDVQLRLGRHAGLLVGLSTRVEAYPLDERLAGQLMLALYRSGRAADALAHYQSVRRRLAEELGTDPGPELRQLHQQILTADPALVTPAPRSVTTAEPVRAPRQLPAPPPMFTGRDAETDVLCKALNPDGARHVRVAAVDGVAGVGKSALAIHVSHRVAERYPDGQLYINLQGAAAAGAVPLTPHEVLVRWLPQFGVPGSEVPVETGAASARWRSLLAGRRLLLVLDDACSAEQVRPLLPAEHGCAVVVTSRSVLSTLDGAEFVHLEPPSEPEAVALLGRLAGEERLACDPAAARAVVGYCERLPLLVRIVAARLASRPGWSVRAIADRLAQEHQRLNELQVGELSVRASLAVSLREAGDEGTRVFALLAVVDATEIDLPLAASLAGLSSTDAEEVLEQLVDARLVDSPEPGYYRMHDVVRLYAREQASLHVAATEREAVRRRVVDHYLSLAGQASRLLDPEEWAAVGAASPIVHPAGFTLADRPTACAWIDFAAPHLPVFMAGLANHPELAADIARCALDAYPALVIRDRWSELIRLSTVGVQAARSSVQPVLEARARNVLGLAYGQTGQFAESLAEFGHALGLWEELGERQQMARASNNLGVLARLRDDLPEAVRCHERSILLFQEAGDSNGQARALTNLGVVHQRLGDHDRAITAHARAAEAFRALGDQYRLGLVLGDLAEAVRLAGRLRESLGRYQDSLRIIREVGNRSGEAQQLWGLAQALYDLGESDAARTHWHAALAIIRDCGDLTDDEVQRILAQPIPEPPAALRRHH
ncbi:BTAD domain-containing putative transcriptional regulator [Peterkaempfera bronchialis]|uniref:AfsR/SARP family transcriptional regulator n=1 Tax=Peterkaempfera bronchialis TaxID=2126346 RepID=UPI003C2E75D1